MADLHRPGESRVYPPPSVRDGTLNLPHIETTPKKSHPEVEYSQWNMWAEEKTHNPASLLAPCTPEFIARIQSVLASPNSEDDIKLRGGYPIQQLMSFVMEPDSEEVSTSTSSSLLYSSDEDISLVDSPRPFSFNHIFGRSACSSSGGGGGSSSTTKRASSASVPTVAAGGGGGGGGGGCAEARFEPQEPAVLPPQLAYASDKWFLATSATSQVVDANHHHHQEIQRFRGHGRQFSDSSVSDETGGYLSSSPSSTSSSSSSYLSTGSSNSYSYAPSISPVPSSMMDHTSAISYYANGFASGPMQPPNLSHMPGNISMCGIPSTMPHGGGNNNMPFYGHVPPTALPHAPGYYPSVYVSHTQMFAPHAVPAHAPNASLQAPPNMPPYMASNALLQSGVHHRNKSMDAISHYSAPHTIGCSEGSANINVELRSAVPLPLGTAKAWELVNGALPYIPTSAVCSGMEEVRHSDTNAPSSLGSAPQSARMSHAKRDMSPQFETRKQGDTHMRSKSNGSRANLPSNVSHRTTAATDPTPRRELSRSHGHPVQSSAVPLSNSSNATSAVTNVSNLNHSSSASSKEADEKVLAKLKEIGDQNGFEEAQSWALAQLNAVSKNQHWRVCMELADLAKRENCHYHARVYYQLATQLNEGEAKTWLEWAKMEEECGHLDLCERLLSEGLRHCGVHSESLVLRSIRVLSSRDKIQQARNLLGHVLRASSPPTSSTSSIASANGANEAHTDVREWKMVLEGALLEWRAGRPKLAHSILQYLQNVMPSRTQPYMSRADLLKKEGKFREALRCVIQGLMHLPNAGMIWFEAFHLQQQIVHRMSTNQNTLNSRFSPKKERNAHAKEAGSVPASTTCATSTTISSAPSNDLSVFAECPLSREEYFGEYLPRFIERALQSLSVELVWKFHLEVAQFFEAVGDVKHARKHLGLSAKTCPSSLVWRVWLAGGKMELSMSQNEEGAARRLLVKAAKAAPKKMLGMVLLEYARVEEYLGRVDEARYVLTKSKRDTKNDWKVYLETILLEMRRGDFEAAIRETRAALAIHPNAGRLWAILIQAHHFLHYQHFDVSELGTQKSKGFEIARDIFSEALKEVPKSGEVWCEGARIALHAGLLSDARRYLGFAVELTSQYGDTTIEFLRLRLLESRLKVSLKSADGDDEATSNNKSCSESDILLPISDPSHFLSLEFNKDDRLAQLCTYADPNYGPVWSFCKTFHHDTSITTMAAAYQLLLDLERSDPTMDLAYHLLGKIQHSMPNRHKLIFA